MSFIIKNLIIHAIHKERPITGQPAVAASHKMVDDVTPTQPDDEWHKLLDTVLTKTNTDRRLQRGNFIDVPGKFKDDFDDYKSQIKDFVFLTKKTTEELFTALKSKNRATGGFILFAEIYADQKNYFYCIMFKQKMGDDLIYDESLKRFILKDVVFIDLEKMHQGFCLEVDDYLTAKDNNSLFDEAGKPYLYFINMQAGSQTNTSDYFIDTFRCRVVENSAKSMRILLNKTVSAFEKNPLLLPYAEDLKKQVTTLYSSCEATKSDIELRKVEDLMKVYQTKAGLSDTEFQPVIDDWFKDLVHSPDNPISASFPVNTDTLDKMRTYKTTVSGFTIYGDKDTLLKSQAYDEVFYDHSRKQIIITLPQPIS